MNRRLTVSLALAVLTLTPQAHADEDDLNQASKKVFQEARSAAEKGDWALCRTRAVGVWQQVKSPNVAGILGICEAELGMNKDAAEHLEFFLAKQTKATPKQVAEVKKSLDKVLPKVAKVTVLPNPDDSDVFLDDVLVGRGKQTVFLNPGDARIGAAKDGQSITKTVSVKAGDVVTEYRIEVPKDPGGAGAGGAGAGGAGAGGAGAGGAGGAGEGAGGAGAGGAGAGGAGAGGSGGGPSEEAPMWPAIVMGAAGGGLLLGGMGLTIGGVVVAGEARTTGECVPFTAACRQEAADQLATADLLQNLGFAGLGLGAASLVGMTLYLVLGGSQPPVAVVPRADAAGLGFTVLGDF